MRGKKVAAAVAAAALGGTLAFGAQAPRARDDAPQPVPVAIAIEARGWDDEGTVAIVHAVASAGDGGAPAYESFHAITASEAKDDEPDITLPSPGTYELTFVSPITSKGRVYETPELTEPEGRAITVPPEDRATEGASGGGTTVEVSFDPIRKSDTDAEVLERIVRGFEEAAASGAADDTLSGDAGERIVKEVREAAGASGTTGEAPEAPRPDAEQQPLADRTDGTSAGKAGESQSTKAVTGTPSGETPQGGGGSGPSGSGPKEPASTDPSGHGMGNGGTASPAGAGASADAGSGRTWVEERGHWEDTFEDRPTYEEVWVQDSEAWDEPVFETDYPTVCNTCGADISGFAVQHLMETEHGGYHTESVTRQTGAIHHEGTGHWESVQTGTERVRTGSAWVVDAPGHWE